MRVFTMNVLLRCPHFLKYSPLNCLHLFGIGGRYFMMQSRYMERTMQNHPCHLKIVRISGAFCLSPNNGGAHNDFTVRRPVIKRQNICWRVFLSIPLVEAPHHGRGYFHQFYRLRQFSGTRAGQKPDQSPDTRINHFSVLLTAALTRSPDACPFMRFMTSPITRPKSFS